MSDNDPMVFSDDYQPERVSPRRLVADEAARLIKDAGLAEVYGGEVSRHPEGKCYRVLISRKRVMDGQVNVYNPAYLIVMWKTTIAGIEPEGRRTFGSLDEAMAFLQLAFVEGRVQEALMVPVYTPKRKKQEKVDDKQPGVSSQQATPEDHVPGNIPIDHFGGQSGAGGSPLDGPESLDIF